LEKTSLQNYLSPRAYRSLQVEKLKRKAQQGLRYYIPKYNIPEPHPNQAKVIYSSAKRKIVRAGRRFGKTTGAAIEACEDFLDGKRILYATPTQDQVERFWVECKNALQEPIERGYFYKNETRHIIELPGTEQRIRAKTAWDADSLRGDYADKLILDEYQLMKAEAWGLVGAPMLLDNDGDALFIYTQSRGKHHSKELFKKASEDTTDRWATFIFSSFDNPHLDPVALDEISMDMTKMAYQAEILAEEIDDDPRALWTRDNIETYRVNTFPDLARVVIGVDPQSTTGQTGVVAVGSAMIGEESHYYVLEDATPPPGVSPERWGSATVAAYNRHQAGRIVGEVNHGGDMIENVIRNVEGGDEVAYYSVRASRGKAIRAEPISARYERGLVHHVGELNELEDEQCNWVPGISNWSPNRIDALVWAITELMSGMDPRDMVSWV
jgi:hypothetical protein